MITTAELKVILSAQDQASGNISKLSSLISGLGNAAKGSAPGFGALTAAFTAANVAAAGIMRGVGGIVGAISDGIKTSTEFGQSMANISAALPAGQFAQFGTQLSDLALQLGKDLPIGAGDAAAGMEVLAKKGIDAQTILEGAGKSVALLASATGEDLAAGATVAAAAINTFGLSGEEVGRVTNLMVGAIIRGGTTVDQFGLGLQAAGVVTKLFGLSVEDLTIALGVMAKAGFRGSDAGTSFKTFLTELIPTTKAAIDAQRELGLVTAAGTSKFVDAGGKLKSYEEISRILAQSLEGLGEVQQAQALKTIFGTDAIRAAGIAADFGAGKFGDFGDAVRAVDAGGVAAERMNTLAGDMENLNGSIQTLVISIGQKLDPAFRGMAQAANASVGSIIDSIKGMDFSGIVTPIQEAFQRAGAIIKGGGSITDAVAAVIGQLNAFAGAMFGAGYTLITTFAQGMVSAIGAVFQAAASVAAAIASFFIGESPPPVGPLSKIDKAGRELVEQYASRMGEANLGPVSDVAEKVQGMLTDFKGLESIGEDVAAQIRMVGDALEEINMLSQDLKFQIEDIKNGYEDQLDPLREQLDLIDDVNDSLSKQQDILDEIAGLDLKSAEAAAKGDPTKRADIKGKQESNRFAQEEIRNQIRGLELDNQKGRNDKKIASLKKTLNDLDKEELALKRELAAISDKGALAEIEKQKTALDLSKESRKIDERKAELQRELLKLPIKEKIKEIEKAQKDQLKPLEAQLEIYARQTAALNFQRSQWQSLAGDIKRAADAVKPAAGGGGGGGGGAGGGGGVKLPNIGETLKSTLEKGAANAKAAAEAAGARVMTDVAAGMRNWFRDNGTAIVTGTIGAVLGGAAFGPIGFLAGGAFGIEFGKALEAKMPGIGKRAGDVLKAALAGLTLNASDKSDELPDIEGGGNNPNAGRTGMLKEVETAFKNLRIAVDQVGTAIKTNLEPALARLGGEIGKKVAVLFQGIKVDATDAGAPVRSLAGGVGILADNLDRIIAISAGAAAAFATFKILEGAPAIITGLSVGIRGLLGPIGLVSVAVGLLAAAWTGNWGGIRDIFDESIRGLVYTWEHDLKPMFAAIDAALVALGIAWDIWNFNRKTNWDAFWKDINIGLINGLNTVAAGMTAQLAAILANWNAWNAERTAAWNAFWAGINIGLINGLNTVAAEMGARLAVIVANWTIWYAGRIAAWTAFWKGLNDDMIAALNTVAASMATWFGARVADWEKFKTDVLRVVTDMVNLINNKIRELRSSWDSAIEGVNAYIESVKNIPRNVVTEIKRVFTGDSPDGRALGGTVQRGTPYMVGERGPELFTPLVSGSITPNNALGSGQTVNNYFNINADARDRPQIQNNMSAAMFELQRANLS